jgi:methanogenic corrinoid protein MtbC1
MGYMEKTLSMDNLKDSIFRSLKRLNEKAAGESLRQAISVYPVDQVFRDLIEPIMVEIGEGWRKKELAVGIEHFATNFFREHIMSILSATPQPFRNGVIVATCLPGEQHELGILMLVVLLRMHGWNVVYLGANISFERLEEVLQPLRPRIILFSSSTSETAVHRDGIPALMQKLPSPHPHVILGGKGFAGFPADPGMPYPILTDSADQLVRRIENLLDSVV